MPMYKSDAFEAIYEDAFANFEIGAITRKELEEYERVCFVSDDSTPSVQNIGLEIPATAQA